MPLYEYQCQDCGHRYERIEKASSPHDGTCPSCGGSARRLLGAPALKFKGSGWYVTDYARKDEQSDSKPKKVTKPPEEKKSSSESVTKTSDSSSAT